MPNRVEKAASEVMGAVKAAKATIENLHGVFKQLTREHGEVTALLLRVKMSSDVKVRRELFPKIRQELLSHEKGELTVVYPMFRQHEELAGYAEMHEREAGSLEGMITRLGSLSYEDPQWAPAFNELVSAVEHHANEEEDDFFPAANKILGKEVAEDLKTRYVAKKNAVMSDGN
jgi:hemerythrin superfamily protein